MDVLEKALAVKREVIHPERQNFCLNKLRRFSKRLNILMEGTQKTPEILLSERKRVYLIDCNPKQCQRAKRDGFQNVIRASWSNIPLKAESGVNWAVYADIFGTRKDINGISTDINRLKTKKLIVLGAARAYRKPAKRKWKYLLKTRFPKLKLKELRTDCRPTQWTAIMSNI